MRPYSIMDTATARKKSRFILSERSDFYMINTVSIVVHALTRCMLTLLSIDEMLLPRYVNWSTNFRGLPLTVEMVPFYQNIFNLFYLYSNRAQYLLLLALGILLGLVYLWEALGHLRSLHLSFSAGYRLLLAFFFFFFFFFFNEKPFSFIRSIDVRST